MTILIVYYSRTGTTKKVAEYLRTKLQCDIEEIFDTKDRSGTIGYLIAGRDAMQKNLTTIKALTKNPADYDLVIIGTPVWAWTMSTPIRTFITENKNNLKNIACFCTMGSSGDAPTFEHIQSLANKPSVAQLALKTKDVLDGTYPEATDKFITNLEIHL